MAKKKFRKVINVVNSNTQYFNDEEGKPTKFVPNEVMEVPAKTWHFNFDGTKVVTMGLLVEVDDTGEKIIKDNLNITLDGEIRDYLNGFWETPKRTSLEDIETRVMEIDSKWTLGRYKRIAKELDFGAAIADNTGAIQARINELEHGEDLLNQMDADTLRTLGLGRRVTTTTV